MENSLRKQAEVLFRKGNTLVSGGSAGTAWERMLDDMVQLLGDDEKLVHIAGYERNTGVNFREWFPATLLTMTSKRVIFQLSPGAEPGFLPLEALTVVERRRTWLGQSDLYIRTIDGDEARIDMPKDIADPFVQAFNATRGSTG